MNQGRNELGLEGPLLSSTFVSSLCSLEALAADDDIVELQIPLRIENWETETPQIKPDEEIPIEIVVQREPDSTIIQPQTFPRRKGHGRKRKQDIISKPDFTGISKKVRKREYLHEKNPNALNIGKDERTRRLRAKKHRNFREKKISDLKSAKMEVILLRVAEEELVNEIRGLKDNLRAMEEQVRKLEAELEKEKQKTEKMEELVRFEGDVLLDKMFNEVDLNSSTLQ